MVKRPERAFYEQLKRNLPKVGLPLDLMRVENVALVGTPDVNYCVTGVDGWAELKAWERVRLTGRFTVPKLREEQATWLSKRAKLGGRAYLLARINKDVVLIDGRYTPALFDKTLHLDWNDGAKIARLWLKPPLDWERLLLALAAEPTYQDVIDEGLRLFRARSVSL